ncbi:MAG: mechanosensitive ion channel, partial [Geminicoccaceae bacterium]
LALTAGGVIAFGIGTIGSFLSFDWPPGVHVALMDFLWAIVLVRGIAALIEFALAPRVDSLRLVPLEKRDAKWLATTFLIVAIAIFFGRGFSDVLEKSGASANVWIGVDIVVTAISALVVIAAIWAIFIRHAERYVPFEGACPRVRGLVLPVAATAAVIAIYLLWLVGAYRLSATLAVIAVTIPIAIMTRRTVLKAFSENDVTVAGERASAEGLIDETATERPSGRHETQPSLYQPIIERLGRFTVLGSAAVALAFIWGFEVGQLSESGSLAGRVFQIGINVAIAFLVGDLVWIITRTAIDRKMASMPKLEHGQAPGPEARMATLLPIFRLAALITIFTMVVMVTLSELGVDIGPLLAGAGVIGLAVGFGAQALVRDIVSGIFFLIDDAFRVGEYIEMGELRGTVESISLRSLRVRHHRGAVHTIPFGELKSLTNYSRDWVMMKLEFRVPFDTDLKLAKKIVKGIDAELRANPDYGGSFIEPLKFQGVRRMEEFNMVVGVKFMTRPGEQWTIRRDAYQRIRDEFEKNGIHFAQRNVKVEVIGNQPLTDDVKRAAVGAAQDAIEQQAGG